MRTKALLSRRDFVVFSTFNTRWHDNDVYGHMNNSVYYQLFDTAVNEYLLQQNILRIDGSQNVFIVAETGCRYNQSIAFPDAVHIGLRIKHIGNSSVQYIIGVFRNNEDHVAAEGSFVHIHVDRKTHRPVTIPPTVKSILSRLCEAEDN